MVRICSVRFDDVCPTMNWKQFNIAMNMMRTYNVKPLLGIIPANEDPEQLYEKPKDEFWEIMKQYQKDGCTIAMHGYKHVYDIECRGMVNTGIKSEFAGHTYEVQNEKIKSGKQVLEEHGIHTDVFFAPSHSYDINTLRALKNNGFKYISDGRSKKPYMQEGIICLPCRYFTVPKKAGNEFNLAVCHSSKWDEYPENVVKLDKYLKDNKLYLKDYKDYISDDLGNYYIQKFDERMYIIWHDYIRKTLARNKFLAIMYRKWSDRK